MKFDNVVKNLDMLVELFDNHVKQFSQGGTACGHGNPDELSFLGGLSAFYTAFTQKTCPFPSLEV